MKAYRYIRSVDNRREAKVEWLKLGLMLSSSFCLLGWAIVLHLVVKGVGA